MKKLFLTVSLLFSLLTLAGPKADIQAAQKLINENKEKEAVDLLKKSKSVKGEEVEFETINNFLGDYYNEQKDTKNAIKYYEIATKNLKSTSEAALEANVSLFKLATTNANKIKYLEQLNKRTSENDPLVLANLDYYYTLQKENKKLDALKKLISSKDASIKGEYYYNLFTLAINDGDSKKVNELIAKIDENGDKDSIFNKNIFIARYLYAQKQADQGDLYFQLAYNLDPNNKDYIFTIVDSYNTLGDKDKALSYYASFADANKDNLSYQSGAFILAVSAGNSELEKKFLDRAKSLDKTITDLDVASVLLNRGLYEGAIKYAKLGEKTNKGESKYIVAAATALLGKYDEAIKYAQESIKANKKEATELLKDIQELKKQSETKK